MISAMLRSKALGLLLLAGCAAPSTSTSTRPPNLVLIVSDDQGWGDYGFMGHPQIRTPRLDALAAVSLRFPRGYVTSSLCCPSLASLLSGLYPHQTKIVSNDPPKPAGLAGAAYYKSEAFRRDRERMNAHMERLATLPRLLGAAGYRSFQTGKWWQGHYRTGGFTDGMSHGDPAKSGRHGDAGLTIGRESMKPIEDFLDGGTAPFFLWYAPMLPHQPHNPPERLLAKYRGKGPSIHLEKYWAMVEWFDETCGQLLDLLERRGLAKETIVAYVVDNGWVQDPEKASFVRSKRTPYDAGLRTPILLSWPGRIEPGTVDRPVSSIDLAPTLLKAAGVAAPPGLPGVDLRDRVAVEARDAVFGAVFAHDAVDLDRPESGLEYRWTVSGDWKLIVPRAGAAQLYHLKDDPEERKGLAAAEGDRVEALRKRLDAWWDPR
jgi:uncharacterized sulfatase